MFKDDKVVKAGEKESPYKSLLVSCLLSKYKGNNFRKSIAFQHNITRIVFFVDSTNTNLQRKPQHTFFFPFCFVGWDKNFDKYCKDCNFTVLLQLIIMSPASVSQAAQPAFVFLFSVLRCHF